MRVVHKQEELVCRVSRRPGARRNRLLALLMFTRRSFWSIPEHIEFQVLGDQHRQSDPSGRARVQHSDGVTRSLIEESPSPAMDAKRRKELGAKVVRALEKVGYTNAGTVEFLMDQDGSHLLHRDEHAHPGRASGHGVGDRSGPDQGADSNRCRRETGRRRRRDEFFRATQSSAVSMLKIPRPLCLRRGASPRFRRLVERESAWIRLPMPTP